MNRTTTQSRDFVGAPKTPGSEVRPRAGSIVAAPRTSECLTDRHLSARSSFIIHRSSFRRAYTLIEVLVVAVVIVLMLGMALPVFRAITGSRSEAGATNIIAATLGRARTDAIGLQKPIGIAFLFNPSTQLSYMAEVEFPDCPTWIQNQTVAPLGYVQLTNTTTGTVYYYINAGVANFPLPAAPTSPSQNWVQPTTSNPMYPVGGPPLEMRPDTELLPLPAGIGVQTVCNCFFSGGTRYTDGYLSFGVILFDGHGRIVSQNYGVSAYSKLMTTSNIKTDYPFVGSSTNSTSPLVYYPTPNMFGVPSQFGLVVFQSEAFISQNFSPNDVAYSTNLSNQNSSTYAPQKPQEDWLDQNATPLLLNRYTGTLIKAE